MLSRPQRALFRYQFEHAKNPNPKMREQGKRFSIALQGVMYLFFGWIVANPFLFSTEDSMGGLMIGGESYPAFWLLVCTFALYLSGFSSSNLIVQIRDKSERTLLEPLPVSTKDLVLAKLLATNCFVLLMALVMAIVPTIAVVGSVESHQAMAALIVAPLALVAAGLVFSSFLTFCMTAILQVVPSKYWTLALSPISLLTFVLFIVFLMSPEEIVSSVDAETALLIPPVSFAAPLYLISGASEASVKWASALTVVAVPLALVLFNLASAWLLARVIDRGDRAAEISKQTKQHKVSGSSLNIPKRLQHSRAGAGWLLARRMIFHDQRARSAMIGSIAMALMSFGMLFFSFASADVGGFLLALSPLFLTLSGVMPAEACRYSSTPGSMDVLDSLPGNPAAHLWLGVLRALAGILVPAFALLGGLAGALIFPHSPITVMVFAVSTPFLWLAGWFASTLSMRDAPFSQSMTAARTGNMFKTMLKIYLLMGISVVPTIIAQAAGMPLEGVALVLLAESMLLALGLGALWFALRGPRVAPR